MAIGALENSARSWSAPDFRRSRRGAAAAHSGTLARGSAAGGGWGAAAGQLLASRIA